MLKEPTYKKGEIVQVLWHGRTSPKGSWFCKDCWKTSKVTLDGRSRYCDTEGCKKTGHFPKILGFAKINEVFKIKMRLEPYEDRLALVLHGIGHELSFMERHKEIPERDGFMSLPQMFMYFDRAYDLSVKRPFWVYRFERVAQ